MRGGHINIVSGDGDGPGIVEVYDGRRTTSAIRTRLRDERAGSDRWAYALIETLGQSMYHGHAVRWDGTNRLMDAVMLDDDDDPQRSLSVGV